MNTVKSFRFEVWSDGKDDRCSIHADIHTGEGEAPGLRYISFYMSREEFAGLVEGRLSAVSDIAHNVRAWGDQWTFYDLEFPRADCGKMVVPYKVLTIPVFVQKLLLTVARKVWTLHRAAIDNKIEVRNRFELKLDQKTRDKYVRLYGQAKGEVAIEMNFDTFEQFKEHSKQEVFKERVEHLKCIARNSTRTFYDKATLKLYKDDTSYYWVALTPRGRTIMNGGLILRDRDGKVDWSIHT